MWHFFGVFLFIKKKFYQEHGIEYKIVQCPNCGRDVADVQQFCLNCGTVLFNESCGFILKVKEKMENKKKNVYMSMM